MANTGDTENIETYVNRPVEAESGSDIEDKPASQSPLTEAEVARKNASDASQPERLKSTPPQSEVGEDSTQKKKEEADTKHRETQLMMEEMKEDARKTKEELTEKIKEMSRKMMRKRRSSQKKSQRSRKIMRNKFKRLR